MISTASSGARYPAFDTVRGDLSPSASAALGSLQRRLRNCLSGVRAEPFAFGAHELVELELYLACRAKGLAVEVPAVRP